MTRLFDGHSSDELERAVQHVSFPARKHDLVHAARQAQAPNTLVGALEQIPQTAFASFDDLLRAYGEMEGGPAGAQHTVSRG